MILLNWQYCCDVALGKSFLCSAYDNSSLINQWSFLRCTRVAQRAERVEGSSRNTKRRSERRSWIPKGCISWRVRRRKSDSPTLSSLLAWEISGCLVKTFPQHMSQERSHRRRLHPRFGIVLTFKPGMQREEAVSRYASPARDKCTGMTPSFRTCS